MRTPLNWWTFAFLFVIAAGIPACLYHAFNGRFGNAIMAGAAVAAGLLLLVTERGRATRTALETPEPAQSREEQAAHPPRVIVAPARDDRGIRVSGAILSGFVATIALVVALLFGYILAGALAQENGNQIQQWFWGLTHNDLTSGVFDIPIASASLNLAAGLVWAFVYALFVERGLSGPGWRKGMLFSLLPWVLSLVVFFPIMGAGFLGADLSAGPLPALGNLVLHLIYGAAIGTMYEIPEVSVSADRVDDAVIARIENDGIAAGLLVGMAVGIVSGAALSVFADSRTFSDTGMLLAGAGLGAAVGGMIGAFAGLDYGARRGMM